MTDPRPPYEHSWEKHLGISISDHSVSPQGDFKVSCPFHTDLVPSLVANVVSGKWNCFGCGVGGNFAEFIKQLYGVDFPTACSIMNDDGVEYTPVVDAEVKPEPKEVPAISPLVAITYHQELLENAERLDYLTVERGMTLETIEKCQVGYCRSRERYTLPVYDEEGFVRNIRFYSPTAAENKVTSWKAGYGIARLFPLHVWGDLSTYHTIVLCEGEMDALCAMSSFRKPGVAFLTTTSGAGTWKPAWNPLFTDKCVIIAYDVDDGGRYGAGRASQALEPVAQDVRILHLPLDPKVYRNGDITDWVVREHATGEDFWRLVESTPDSY